MTLKLTDIMNKLHDNQIMIIQHGSEQICCCEARVLNTTIDKRFFEMNIETLQAIVVDDIPVMYVYFYY